MAKKGKKRLSKKSKAIQKILEKSKELENSKNAANVRIDSGFTIPGKPTGPNLAHKPRPHKKRGG